MMWNSKNSVRLKSQIRLQFWKTWMMMLVMMMLMIWISMGLGEVFERI
jgi:hypothetical protein